MTQLVDSHCHLNYKGLIEDVEGVIERARAAGVGHMLSINTKLEDLDEILSIISGADDIHATAGVHPHEAGDHAVQSLDALIDKTQNAQVVGIGESGLDYYYDNAPREKQRESFRLHINAAQETGLPLVVHTRDAEDDTAQLLREEMERKPFKGVIHCFTASDAFADIALDLGFYISLSGIVTFKSARELQATAKRLPLERLLVETDSPFLAPVPHRGKTCEPAFVAHTARFLAELRGEEFETLAAATTANFFSLFDQAKPAA
ncbi:MAG: TatD family hydrolase [Pseudomonadota bacterium]